MLVTGRIFKDKNTSPYWAVDINDLGIHTQGVSKKDAIAMAKDAIETVIDTDGFEAMVESPDGKTLFISSNNNRLLLALFFKNLRVQCDLTLQEVADRMGEKSVTGYSRYEHGKVSPSIDKITDIIRAIDPDKDFIFKVG
jgi:predicted RNase H-like HicB family nuclease/DNA-binding XRE family transcriptional regulator